MNKRAIILNELSQDIRPIEDGIAWFQGLTDSEQLATLRDLAIFCIQARATTEDGPESIRRAKIKPTHTPAVMISREPLAGQLEKVVNLPRDERSKSFRLLIALLSVADERRRARFCAAGCSHSWHHLEAASSHQATELES